MEWVRSGVVGKTRFKSPPIRIGDVDRDGFDDICLAGYVSLQGAPAQQAMHILSGRSGQPIRVKAVPRSHLAVALAPAGDVDGDGIADYALSYKIWQQLIHRIEVLSGRDDRVIWSVDRPETTLFGNSMIGGLDVNGDDRPDLVATAPRMTPYGAVLAFDHRGRQIHRLDGTAALLIGYKTTGVTIDAVGDVNGDGADDYVVGGRDHRTDPLGRGAAVLVSGRSGKPHWIATEQRTRSLIGDVVTGVGDLNGDSVPDLVAASNATRNGTAAMYLFSGHDGSELRLWLQAHGFGDLDGGIDVDRDGSLDILVGPIAFSGRDGSQVFFYRRRDTRYIGASVRAWGSVPGQAFPRWLITEPDWFPHGPPMYLLGRLHALNGAPPGVRVFGRPCGRAGVEPTIGLRHIRSLRSPIREPESVRVTVFGAKPGVPAALMVGQSNTAHAGRNLPLSLQSVGLPSCALLVSPDLVVPTMTGTTGVDAGFAKLELPINLSATGRVPLFAQWITLDQTASRVDGVSDAITWRSW